MQVYDKAHVKSIANRRARFIVATADLSANRVLSDESGGFPINSHALLGTSQHEMVGFQPFQKNLALQFY